MMNMMYLNSLPEVENRYNVKLESGEKVIFATKLNTFGTEKDSWLGSDCEFTMTNKRIIIYNGAGIWTVNIEDEIVSCTKIRRRFIFKAVYFAVTLNEDMIFDHGRQKLSGFHFYFDENATVQFEEIMNNLLNYN